MSPSPTEQYIDTLTQLKTGDLGLLRTHAGQGLDESLEGFDLFAGLWWPLREKNQRAPRREVAWLIAKLYAFSPIPHATGETLARRLRQCQPSEEKARARFRSRFDAMLLLSVDQIEPALQWGLGLVGSDKGTLDWVELTDDLSKWNQDVTRLKWAEQFLG